MGSSCSTASVYIQMDEIVAMARSRRIEEAISKEEVITIRLIRAIIRVVLIKTVMRPRRHHPISTKSVMKSFL